MFRGLDAARARVAERYRHWRARSRLRRELAELPASEFDRVLADAGMSRSDLATMFGGRAGNRGLMARMMAHFGLRMNQVPVAYWGALKDAERVCAYCKSDGRCRRWLNWGAKNDAPRLFCPNAELFDEMGRNWRD